MRKEFSASIEKIASAEPKVIFLTGDLGFMALENVQAAMGTRFINAGVSEQNLVSLAAGLASQGYTVLCYSIAPFAVFRPAEQIRIDVCLHNMNVKIIGNGGGYGYGIMAATLKAYWKLDEGSGTQALDSSGNGLTGTITGAVWKQRGNGYILQFDGTGTFVNCGNPAALDLTGPLSLSVWVRPDLVPSPYPAEPLIAGRNMFTNYAMTYYVDGISYGYIGGGGNNVQSNALTLREWSHLVMVYDGTYMRLYRNGAQIGVDHLSTSTPQSNSNATRACA